MVVGFHDYVAFAVFGTTCPQRCLGAQEVAFVLHGMLAQSFDRHLRAVNGALENLRVDAHAAGSFAVRKAREYMCVHLPRCVNSKRRVRTQLRKL